MQNWIFDIQFPQCLIFQFLLIEHHIKLFHLEALNSVQWTHQSRSKNLKDFICVMVRICILKYIQIRHAETRKSIHIMCQMPYNTIWKFLQPSKKKKKERTIQICKLRTSNWNRRTNVQIISTRIQNIVAIISNSFKDMKNLLNSQQIWLSCSLRACIQHILWLDCVFQLFVSRLTKFIHRRIQCSPVAS